MQQKTKNPYATNAGGKIEAPKGVKNEPKGTRTVSENDLRVKKATI